MGGMGDSKDMRFLEALGRLVYDKEEIIWGNYEVWEVLNAPPHLQVQAALEAITC